MRYSDIKKIFIFNSFIFSVIIVLGVIMLFRASYAANVSDGSNLSNVWDGVSRSSSFSGSGTESDPYLIQNANDLALYVYKCNNDNYFKYGGKYVSIENNIYLNDGYFDYNDPSYNGVVYYKNNKKYYVGDQGKYYSSMSLTNQVGTLNQLDSISYVYGHIEGNGHSISGLYSYNTGSEGGFINGGTGSINYLKVVNSVVIGSGIVGFLASYSGEVYGCSYSGLIKNIASASDTNYTGFVGKLNGNSSSMTRVAVSGKIIGSGGYTGGVIGYAATPSIRNTYSRGTVSSSSGYVGGVIGLLKKNMTIYNAYYSGNITGTTTGGIIGYIDGNYTVSLSNVLSIVDGSSLSGVIIGAVNNTSSITLSYDDCYFTGQGYDIGGNSSNVTISGTVDGISRNNLLKINKLKDIGFLSVTNGPYALDHIWYLNDQQIPIIYFDDYTPPTVRVLFHKNSDNSDTDVTGTSSTNTIQTISSDGYLYLDINEYNDIAKIEYYVRNDYYTTSVLTATSITYSLYPGNINVERGDCKSIYYKVTDIYGNISYVHSSMLLYDGYKITTSEGVDQDQFQISDYDTINNSATYNIHVKHAYTKSSSLSFPNTYSSLKQRLVIAGYKFPVNTQITLYDKKTKNTYYYKTVSSTSYTSIDGGVHYIFDLGYLRSVFDNTAYNNNVSNYINGNSIDEDFIISFKFPNLNSVFSFGTMGGSGNKSSIVSNIEPAGSPAYLGNIYGRVVNATDSTTMSYYLNTNTSSISLSSSGVTEELSMFITKNIGMDAGHRIYDPEVNQKKYSLEAKFIDSNGNVLSPFIGGNVKFQLTSGSSTYTFNNKSDGIAYCDFQPTFVGGPTSFQSTLALKISTLSTNYLNILPGIYTLRLQLKSDDNLRATKDITVSFGSSVFAIDNYSFTGSMSKNDRIINHTSGMTLNNSNNIYYNYKYTSYSKNGMELYLRLFEYEMDVDNNVIFTMKNPNILFDESGRQFIYNRDAYDYEIELCEPNVECHQPLKLKNNIPTGTYVLEWILKSNGRNVSKERFNLIVK